MVQDTPSGRIVHRGPFDKPLSHQQQSDGKVEEVEARAAGSPHLKVPQNTPAAGNLVALKDVLLKTSSSGGDESDEEASENDSAVVRSGMGMSHTGQPVLSTGSAVSTGGDSVAAEVRAKLMALCLSQESQVGI